LTLKNLANREAAKRQADRVHDDYLRRIDCEAVLSHYGADNVTPLRKPDGTNELRHSCIVDRVDPHHTNGDANPSASLNLDKKKWVCYSYPEGGGDIFWLIMKMEGKEHFYEIIPMLSEFLNDSISEPVAFLKELESAWTRGDWTIHMPRFHERVLEQWAWFHPYLKERGVTHEAASKLQVGYDEVQRRITFPHWHDGVLVGWQKRLLNDPRWPQSLPEDDGRTPKYKNSSGFPKGHSLYGMDNARGRSDVIVVESPMSVLKAESLGLKNTVVATFGAKVTDAQIELMRNWRKVYIWMDDDPAGQGAMRRICNKLERHTQVFVVTPDQGKDLADCQTREEVDEKINDAIPYYLMEMERAHGAQ
jgi:5S rRNA maturation endonuclease (ribonuclease M5)